MPAPIVYHGNLLTSGTCFQLGQLNQSETKFLADPDNPYARQHDGSHLLRYLASGTIYAGIIHYSTLIVALPMSGHDPDAAWVWATGCNGSGHTFTWGNAVDDDGTSALNLHSKVFNPETLSGLYVGDVSDVNRRPDRVYYYATLVWLTSWGIPGVYEFGLSKKWTMPRAPEVGVAREFVNQTTRVPIPGGQPFVKRDGPILRRTTYQAVMLSGAEINAFNAFIADVEGGEVFPFTDDLGATYLAELLNPEIATADEAGVYRATLVFQEVRRELN